MASSPFPKSTSTAGRGRIVVKLQPNGIPGLETITYQYPLKLISPSTSAHTKSVLIFLLSYGGGLVGGDDVCLDVDIEESAKLSIVTQGHTKIFKSLSPDIVTRQRLNIQIASGAGLCLLPDPVQPFEASVYEQTQIFKLAPNASLFFLDWVTQGRSARGENWSFVRWNGRNEVWVTAGDQERLLVRDSMILEGDTTQAVHGTLRETMQGKAVYGTLILRGPMTKDLGEFCMAEFAALPRLGGRDFEGHGEELEEVGNPWRQGRLELEKARGVLWSAATTRGCVVVKFGSSTVEGGRLWVGSMLAEQGHIARLFGKDALMCVQ